ncbi:MAG: hypothetical protein ACREF8_02365 [Chthoniobacterales bacterium]
MAERGPSFSSWTADIFYCEREDKPFEQPRPRRQKKKELKTLPKPQADLPLFPETVQP